MSIFLVLNFLFRRGGPMVYFKEIYKFLCFHSGEGEVPNFSVGPIANSYGNL